MQQSTVINNVKEYVNNQLIAAALSPDGLVSSGLIDLAGCDLSPSWFNKLLADRVRKITSMQLIGLRRLFGDPIDTIIGTELYVVNNCNRMAGLKRIRYEMGESKPKTQKDYADRANCSTPIIARIETASYLAVRERWADIDTDVERVYSGLLTMATFSVDVLIRLRASIHVNIEDIMGLGDYDDDCFNEIVFVGGRRKKKYFTRAEMDSLSEVQKKHPEQVYSGSDTEPEQETEKDRITREMRKELAMLDAEPPILSAEEKKAHDKRIIASFARNHNRTASDTLTGFIPKGIA